MTTSLVRGGDGNGNGNGNGEQEDLLSTTVSDNHIESNTNSFVEEEERGLLGDCYPDEERCTKHSGNRLACHKRIEAGRCYWYPDAYYYEVHGVCSSCSGVNCGGYHRAIECYECPFFDNKVHQHHFGEKKILPWRMQMV